MTETKKRGRPSRADIAAREAAKGETTHNGDTAYSPEPKDEPMQKPALLQPTDEERAARQAAQAFARKVWESQSTSIGRGVRVARVRAALEKRGMSMDGVKLPGDKSDDSEWTEDDEKPITWRKPGA